ncbi:hypothetical protein AB0H77_29195 [Streptomyces sp. NPDC050844]|uniref:hypothetical protein n=1 Tax=Streptomyces sp. NPDC050844 TaxID=3155790 RepID=UPI0033EA4EE8
MAPAAAVAASIPAGTAFAGGSLPLSVLTALVACLFIVAFVPALLTAAGLPVFDFVSELTAPVSYAGPVVGGWMLIGVVVLAVLLRRHPERIAETARVHLDDDTTPDPSQCGAALR